MSTVKTVNVQHPSAASANISLDNLGNVSIPTTGARITGDLTNATLANRLAFQTTTVNGATAPLIIPNGTGSTAGIIGFNSSDPDNASFCSLLAVGSTDVRLSSGATGTGTNRPMTFFTGGSERVRIDTSGNVLIGVSTASATGLNVAAGYNISFGEGSANTTYTNFFRQSSSGAAVIGYALKYSATANGFASSVSSAFARSAIVADGGAIKLYTDSASTVASGTDITPTERLRIDSSGNVGIGTSSPHTSGLTVYKGSGSAGIRCASGGNTSDITQAGADLYVVNNMNGPIQMWTNGSERGRFTSSGDFLVGTTDSGATTGAGFKLLDNGKVPSLVSAYTTNANSSFLMYSTGAGAYRFYVRWDGVIQATSATITAISDQRLKENVRDLDVGLDAIMALKPRKFDWKAGKGADIKNARGFIAQEFEKVFPDLIDLSMDPVPEGEAPYKSIRADLIPILVKSIQELKAELDAVKAELATVKGA